jgi:hypothetical protein
MLILFINIPNMPPPSDFEVQFKIVEFIISRE